MCVLVLLSCVQTFVATVISHENRVRRLARLLKNHLGSDFTPGDREELVINDDRPFGRSIACLGWIRFG